MMKTSALLLFILALPTGIIAQWKEGVSLTGGYSFDEQASLSVSYFHPVIVKQMYVIGGFLGTSFDEPVRSLDVIGVEQTAGEQLFVGFRLGDYLFVSPKISYNWYGRQNSVGWGFAGGLLIHPMDGISFGFAIGYDQFRIGDRDFAFPEPMTSFSAVLNCYVSD